MSNLLNIYLFNSIFKDVSNNKAYISFKGQAIRLSLFYKTVIHIF